MGKTYDLLVRARGETKDAERAMKQLQRTVDRSGKKISGIGRSMSMAITAPLVGLGVMGARELGQIEAANARTAAALERLGPKSRVGVKGVQALAAALQEKSGIDDQVIQSGANLLLSMGMIDTRTKLGEKTLKMATRSMVEFAEQTGVTAEVAGKQYAKSMAAAAAGTLTLPKGMKLGVLATNQLKKAFEESNSAQERQALLADVLSKKFAGSMNLTNADKWNVAMDKLAGSAAKLVTFLLPAFDKLTNVIGSVTGWFEKLSPHAQKLVGTGLLLAAALGPVLIIVGSLVSASSALIPVIVGITAPMLLVGAAVVGLGAALVIAYTKSERFRNVVNGAFRAVAAVVKEIVASMKATIGQWIDWARAAWDRWGDDIMKVIRPAARMWQTLISAGMKNLRDVVLVVLAALRGDWKEAGDKIKGIVDRTWASLKKAFENGSEANKQAVKLLAKAIKGMAHLFADAGKKLGKAIVDGVIDGVRNNAGNIASEIAGVLGGQVGRAIDEAVDGAQRGNGRSSRGKSGQQKAASGISVLGQLFGANVSIAQVLGFASTSTSQPYSVVTGSDGKQSVQTNEVAKSFLEQRVAANKKRIESLLGQRKKAVASLPKARTALKAANQRLATARKRGDKKAIVAANKAIDAARTRVGNLEGAIEYYDQEILQLGGEVQSDQSALEPPSIDDSTEAAESSSSTAAESSSSSTSSSADALSGLGGALTQGSIWQPLMPSSQSALGAVGDAAMRALGGNAVFNITSGDPEAVARRVAFILGNNMTRAGGAF